MPCTSFSNTWYNSVISGGSGGKGELDGEPIADIIEKSLTLLAAVLTVTAAVYGFRRTRRESAAQPVDPSLSLVKVTKNLGNKIKPEADTLPREDIQSGLWSWIVVAVLSLLFGGGFTYFGFASDQPDWFFIGLGGFYLLGSYLCLLIFIVPHWRALSSIRNASSRGIPQPTAEITVLDEDRHATQARCITALRTAGAEIVEIDSDTESGSTLIRAVQGLKEDPRASPTAAADVITVNIARQGDHTVVTISSMGVRPTFKSNVVRHKAFVNRFVDEFMT